VTPVVVFDRVSKKFRRGESHPTLFTLIPALAGRLIGRSVRTDVDEFWALRDVSFEVGRGEALGIIGPNGSGKSTTLRILTRIIKPTSGSCSIRGRAGVLIELAAGFHPELTGRENIYLQGAVMGMKRAAIASAFEAIVEFSGIPEFIDTPVKRYSSGMNARLGFAIAAHLDPDVLVVDEVLGVGDESFQQRCLERLRVLKARGATLVFVSHNLPAVEELCDRAIVLVQGEVAFAGHPREATARYRGETAAAH
jgi:lipopolysaccharide transport system ATP-binding protein